LNLYTAFLPAAIHVDQTSLFIIQRTACSVAGLTIPVSSSRNNIELSVAACLIGCGDVVLPQSENSLLFQKYPPYDLNMSTIVDLPLPVVPVKSNDG
jgi:hypothetical protein